MNRNRSLGTSEVAWVLERHPHTVLKWLKTGQIHGAYLNGGCWMLRSERLREFITDKGYPAEILERLESLLEREES